MVDEDAVNKARAKAEAMVTAAVDGNQDISTDNRATLVDALTIDLSSASNKAAVDEERLAKVETQTRVLSEAVIAIADAADAIGPAVKAVKAEM